jgi:hypothetical protein
MVRVSVHKVRRATAAFGYVYFLPHLGGAWAILAQVISQIEKSRS